MSICHRQRKGTSRSGVFPNLFLTLQQSSTAFNNNNTKNPLLFTVLLVQVSDLLLKAVALPVSQLGQLGRDGSRAAEPATHPAQPSALDFIAS